MADIDQIIAGGAGASSRVEFPDFAKAFFDSNKQRAEFDLRRAFKDGVPTDASGQPDFAAMAKTLFQKGDLGQGIAAANLGLARDQLRYGQQQSADIANVEGGGQPAARPAIVSPPSANRSASVTVAPAIGQGKDTSSAQPARGATVAQVLEAQGIPNDQLGNASASIARQLGLSDPNAPIDINDPQVRNVLVPAVQQLKRMGIGQPAQPGQPAVQAIPPVQQQPQVAQAQPAPVVAQGTGQPAPVTDRLTTQGPADPSRADKLIAYYSGIMSSPMSPKQNVELAKVRLEALQKSAELTPDQKQYSQGVLQGFKGTFQDWLAENEAKKTAATEEAKSSTKKYEGLIEAGTKAQMEIPQLQLLQEQMNDPNFFSGAGEKYNLLYKRLKSAVGIDPEAAVPQEYLRKATAANVLSSLGALKGLGQIRVAEINMAREAAASPENSIPANKLLVEISKRTHERNAQIAEMAQSYKEKNGVLDAGFDKQVTAYYKKNPLFTDGEIKDWHNIIGQGGQKQAAANQQRFASPADVNAAVKAGKLKSGDSFLDSKGTTRYVP